MDYNSYTFKNKVVDRINDGDPKKKKTAKLKKGKVTELEEIQGIQKQHKGLGKNIKARYQSKTSTKRKLTEKAKKLAEKGKSKKAEGGDKNQKKAEKLYKKSDLLKAKAKKAGEKSFAVSKKKGGRKLVTFEDGKKVGKHWRAKGLN